MDTPGEVVLGAFPAADVEYGGDHLGDLPVRGYRSLLDPLADGLDIRLETPVVSIRVGRDGVQVTGAAGATENAGHVVVTVPLGVLQARRSWSPPSYAGSRYA